MEDSPRKKESPSHEVMSTEGKIKKSGVLDKHHMIKPKFLRISVKILLWIVFAVVLVPVLLYFPPVQTLLKNAVCSVVNKQAGMNVEVGKFRLKFPLDVLIEDVVVREESGDTLVAAEKAVVDVKLLPLLKLDVKVNKVGLEKGMFRMVSQDSSMIMKIKAMALEVDGGSSADIGGGMISINRAKLRGGDVSLYMNVWKKSAAATDSAASQLCIVAHELDVEGMRFGMSMLPTIDTLSLDVRKLRLRDGVIDLGKNTVTAGGLFAEGGKVLYLTPDAEYVSVHPAPQSETNGQGASEMVIKGDSVSLRHFNVVYAVSGATPVAGFDPSYVELEEVNVALSGFYNAGSTIRLPLASLSARERCGLEIVEGNGLVAVSEEGISLDSVSVSTPWSKLKATAVIPYALMELKGEAPLNAKLSGHLGWPDVDSFMPDLKDYTALFPVRSPLDVEAQAYGTLGDISRIEIEASVAGVVSLGARGKAANLLKPDRLAGELEFAGKVANPALFNGLLGKAGVHLPKMDLNGRAIASHGKYAADFSLLTSAGDLAATGRLGIASEGYGADIRVNKVNPGAIMPGIGVSGITGRLKAAGNGFNPTLRNAKTNIKLDIEELFYGKERLAGIKADIAMSDGRFTFDALSQNEAARFRMAGSGKVAPDLYEFDMEAVVNNLDLHALGISGTPNNGSVSVLLSGSVSPGKWLYDVHADVDSLQWTAGNQYFSFPHKVELDFHSSAETTRASVSSFMTSVEYKSQSGLKHLMQAFSSVADTVTRQIDRRYVDFEVIQRMIPSMKLTFDFSGRGDVGRYMNTVGLSADTIYGSISNDSLLRANITAIRLGNETMTADTLSLGVKQREGLLDYVAHMGNRKGNPLGEFADVDIRGYLGDNRMLVSLTQKNPKGETGYRIGLGAAVADSVLSVHFSPLKATIAYLPWNFNADNYVEYNLFTRHLDANLTAASKESSVMLKTQPGKDGNDELALAIKNVNIQDFLKMSVFAPPVTATVNADMKVVYTGQWLYGSGDLDITGFTYDRLRVGDFCLDFGAGLNNDGTTGARVGLKIDGAPAANAEIVLVPDSLTKTLSPDKVGLNLTRFPLYIANPFLGADVARLSGYLNGEMEMKGTFTSPLLYGSMSCDSVSVYIPMIGSSLRFADDSISVRENVLDLDRFEIRAANSSPLVADGTVDARELSNPVFRLTLAGKNFQLIGNSKNSRSDVYGKLFMDVDASVTGPMEHFSINGDVNVLQQTDVTYSVPGTTTQQLTSKDAGDVVKFVNFNDTTPQRKDSVQRAVSMRIVASLSIEPGAEVQVEIPGTATTGNGKVQLSPSGTLNYFQNYMGDMRLNGQLYLGEGYVRYAVPVIGEKRFIFNPESYVLWNGDIMNPVLSISADDYVKANLVQNGNSRIVNFDVSLNVANNLSQPKVMFDLTTEDDMTIENDLLSMTAEQRNMAAINLLVTGQYNAQGVKTASSDLLQTAAYGLLTSQLNSWMANHVKGVDLSFGVNQYDTYTNGEAGSSTSYSYQMSKSLFDNKFKISVGGNYTTDASADENFSENLISDISFEYMIRQTANTTMYGRLFRHTGFESILEGEITETGIGFVFKRRLADLRNLFRIGNLFRRREEKEIKTDSVKTENGHENK